MHSQSLARAHREHKSVNCAVFANMRAGYNWCLMKTLGIHLFQTVFPFSHLFATHAVERRENGEPGLDIIYLKVTTVPPACVANM